MEPPSLFLSLSEKTMPPSHLAESHDSPGVSSGYYPSFVFVVQEIEMDV